MFFDKDGLDMVELVVHASLPVQFIMAVLLAASITSWVIIFRKTRVITRALAAADLFKDRFSLSGNELHILLTEPPTSLDGMQAILEAGLRGFGDPHECPDADIRPNLEEAQRAMRAAGSLELEELEHNLELLANVGSTAPYIGLVGTVFGIMVTMHSMLGSGSQAGIKDVAPGISEALIATALGLFVAIPAVWAFNRLTKNVERIAMRYEAFAEEVASILQRRTNC